MGSLKVGWGMAAVLMGSVGVWGQEGLTRRIPPEDLAILSRVAQEYGLQGQARRLLYAIRIVENGGPGREMGVLVPAAMRYGGDHARSLELQARWAAGTIRRRYTGDLEAFAARWAPVGAANDPTGLNRHWLANVRAVLGDEGRGEKKK